MTAAKTWIGDSLPFAGVVEWLVGVFILSSTPPLHPDKAASQRLTSHHLRSLLEGFPESRVHFPVSTANSCAMDVVYPMITKVIFMCFISLWFPLSTLATPQQTVTAEALNNGAYCQSILDSCPFAQAG